LKARLLREASRNVYAHMIGFDHEPLLKSKLEKIVFETKLYRRDSRIDCLIERAEPGWVSINLTTQYEMINQTLDNQSYTPSFVFANGDNPQAAEFTTIVGDGEQVKVNKAFVRLDAGRREAKGDSIELQPRTRGIRYRFVAKCKFRAPSNYYHPLYFGQPTIDVDVSMKGPEEWKLWVVGLEPKFEEPTTNEVQWHFSGLMMLGEHIEFNWREPTGETSPTSEHR
jgi:hypothetical protein